MIPRVRESYNSSDIDVASRRVISTLGSLLDARVERVLMTSHNRPVINTQLQLLFNLRLNNVLERQLYELIVTHGVACEKLAPGGFRLFLERLSDNTCVTSMPSCGNHATRADIRRLIDRHASLGGHMVYALTMHAIELAGFGGKVIIEKSKSSSPSIELVRGYTFDLQQLIPVDFVFSHPRIACIDGYIESVSEIHHLLEAASEAKEPLLVFLRGISDDVKHTLKVNYDRGSLRVVPIAARFDLEGMNTLVDLSCVAGVDLTSSLKGDLISSIRFETLPRIDQATMFRGRVVLVNRQTHLAVNVHLNNLRKRREEAEVDDVGKLLDARIRSLTPNHVVVRLPDDKDYVIHSQAIDYALRATRSAIEHGLDSDGNLAVAQLAARHHASACVQIMKRLGCLISVP